jgi:hypothetical protein
MLGSGQFEKPVLDQGSDKNRPHACRNNSLRSIVIVITGMRCPILFFLI